MTSFYGVPFWQVLTVAALIGAVNPIAGRLGDRAGRALYARCKRLGGRG